MIAYLQDIGSDTATREFRDQVAHHAIDTAVARRGNENGKLRRILARLPWTSNQRSRKVEQSGAALSVRRTHLAPPNPIYWLQRRGARPVLTRFEGDNVVPSTATCQPAER